MKKIAFYTGIITLFVFLLSCGNSKKIMKKNSAALGVYGGFLPCADCGGIQTTLCLNEGGKYRMKMHYLDAKWKSVFIDSGAYSMSKTGDTLKLSDGTKYLYSPQQITQLSVDGKLITGSLASNFIFHNMKNQLTEVYWKLLTLNGRKVNLDSSISKEIFIVLDSNSHRMHGNAGCNIINGSYKLGKDSSIHFERIISTKMACPNLKTENAFMKMIENVDQYSVDNGTLIFSKDGKKTAQFKAIYMHK